MSRDFAEVLDHVTMIFGFLKTTSAYVPTSPLDTQWSSVPLDSEWSSFGGIGSIKQTHTHDVFQSKASIYREAEKFSETSKDMCRFLVYKGKDEILLSKLILDPQHSILTQSYDSRLRMDHRRPHNGDGFGIGYYTPPTLGPDPCIFTSTTPAWNCINLSRLASKTTSSLIFAHVRATTEGSLADSNCHPFSHGSLMFMHNGNIACWRHVKREIALSIGGKWFVGVQGNTDSEWAFALFLDCLEKAGFDPDSEDCTLNGFGHAALRKAMLETIKRINGFVDATPSELRDEMVDKRSLLNFAVSDGHSVVCTRYVSSTTDEAASLYFSSGTSWKQGEGPGQYKMERRDRGADIVLVASEPLTFERDNWVTVPTNSTITIHKQTVMIHPIIDDYYNHSPSYTRSSGFAVSKGLVSNAPGATQAITPGNLGNAVAA